MEQNEPKKILVSTHLKNGLSEVSKRVHQSDFELHWHDFFEIEIIISGSGTQILNGEPYEIREGQISLLTTTDFHKFTTDNEYRQYNVRISQEAISEKNLDKILNINDNIISYFTGENFKKMIYLAELLKMENDSGDEAYIKNIVDCMIDLILRNFTKKDEKIITSSKMLIHKASVYMRIHFREKLHLNEIAAYVNLNPSYFCRFFTDEMGMSPKKYLSDLRLKYAKKLILTTSAPITEICFACGYTSLSNFLKAFKQKYETTPGKIRECGKSLK